VRSAGPTGKLNAYRESVYRDRHEDVDLQVYLEVDRKVYQVDHNCSKAAHRERTDKIDWMVTEADFER
jgi:hypothetical protein